MPRLLFYGAISLDGYLAGRHDELDWLHATYLGEAGATTYDTFIEIVDTLVMGRVTFEETMRSISLDDWIGERSIIIFSRNTDYVYDDERVTIVHTDPITYLIALQSEDDAGDIWIVGGGQLLKPILEADLIDEWWIQIAPVLLGQGKPLFEVGDYAKRLEFVDSIQMGELIELHYRRK